MKTGMRLALVLLALLSASYASSFGFSRITLHRTWEITSDAPFEFTGALAVNDSNQRVVSVTTEPEMERFVDDNGTIMLRYIGNGTITLKADATVDIDYDPQLSGDPSVPGQPLESTDLTQADEDIMHQARELSHDESALSTIRDMVNWVHGNVTYDIGYWGKSKSAIDVFRERRGVCVEYTHLLISLARSLGFQTRYVSGYVYSNTWQPHAWAEIYLPGHGWLPADATFGQAGVLDSTHLAIRKSDDQSASYDLLLSQDEDVDIQARDSLEVGFESEDPKGVSIGLHMDEQTYVAEVAIANSRPDYVLGSFSLALPDNFGGEKTSVLLLRPNETLRLYQGLNHSLFAEGFYYTVPVYASFNDAQDDDTLTVDRFSPPEDDGSGTAAGQSGCASSLILLCAISLAAFAAWKL
jgi:transglutaminase-like putative cysteine protease